MKCYAGIDIGSTNIKLVVIDEKGDLCHKAISPTPYIQDSYRCFDVQAIDKVVDGMIEHAKPFGRLISVSFSSVGESVVPVKDGRALGNAVFHGELTQPTKEEEKIISKFSQYEKTGVISNGLLSLEKILWHHRNNAEKPEQFLPFTSYKVYRKTGCSTWCYSQASRSNAYMVAEKRWNYELLEALGIDAPGELGPHGMYCGEKDGILYGLGGHDHISALYGLFKITGTSEFFLDSMGTSNMIALLLNKPLAVQSTYNPLGGGIVNGFDEGQSVLFRGLPLYGGFLAHWMKRFGYTVTNENIRAINRQIVENKEKALAFTAIIGGNFYHNKQLKLRDIEYPRIENNCSIDRYIESVYAYNTMKTVQLVTDLGSFSNNAAIPYYCAGAATSNEVLMGMKATALRRPIICPDVGEVSALGAVCAGVEAAGEREVFDYMKEKLASGNTVIPSERYAAFVNKARDSYRSVSF